MCETKISDLQEENIDPRILIPLKITKALFCSPEEFHFDDFVSKVQEYIETNRINKETISNILGVFTIVRPKEQELLTKIENAISTTHSSMARNFEEIFLFELPHIFKLVTTQSPLLEFIKNDDFSSLQEFLSNTIDFDFSQTYGVQYGSINLLDIAAYYGSIDCFKYFVVNNAPFSEYVCPFSICGGNYEIIHYLENNFREQNFENENSLNMSIAYHQYAITDYLIDNYSIELTAHETTISSFNYCFFSTTFSESKSSKVIEEELFLSSASIGNFPIVQYLCEVAKVNTEATTEDGRTALCIASSNGYLPIVQYLCEVAKVNTEATDIWGKTALHYACQSGYLPIVQYLCEVTKVNTEATTKDGRTALHYACIYGYLPIVQYLCEVAKVNTTQKKETNMEKRHYALLFQMTIYQLSNIYVKWPKLTRKQQQKKEIQHYTMHVIMAIYQLSNIYVK